jgi:hypothetical protein
MPSTWTDNLGLEKPATGEQAGVWGNIVNNSYDFLDDGIDGNVSIPMSASSYDLLTNPGAPSLARNKVIIFTGAISQNGTVRILPNSAAKIYFVTNKTDGGFSLTFTQGTGPGFTLTNGRSAIIFAQGIGGASGVAGVLNDLQVNSLLVQANLIVQGQVQWQVPTIFNQPATFQGLATFTAGCSITAPLTLTLGADAPYDLYYRSPGGPVTRLAIGANGTVLASGPSGFQWATLNVSVNMPIVNASPWGVFFASGSGTLIQDVSMIYYPGTGLGIGIPPSRALCLGGAGVSPSIQMDNTGVTPAARTIVITTNGLLRWSFGASADTEVNQSTPGEVAGSNFQLLSWNNANTVGKYNFCSYRSGRSTFGVYNDSFNSQLAVVNTVASDAGLTVVGAANQTGYLQKWTNSAGTVVASIDVNGTLYFANNPYLSLTPQRRLEIGTPASAVHPVGTLHIGKDNQAVDCNCCIVMERATVISTLSNAPGVMRILYTGAGAGGICIEFTSGGTTYYARMAFQTGGTGSWDFATVPLF